MPKEFENFNGINGLVSEKDQSMKQRLKGMQSHGNQIRMSRGAQEEYQTVNDSTKGTIDDILGQAFGNSNSNSLT